MTWRELHKRNVQRMRDRVVISRPKVGEGVVGEAVAKKRDSQKVRQVLKVSRKQDLVGEQVWGEVQEQGF